jgi:hypothetical protein
MVHGEAGVKAAHEPGVKVWGQCIVKRACTQREFEHRVHFIERHQIDCPYVHDSDAHAWNGTVDQLRCRDHAVAHWQTQLEAL